MPRDMKSLAHMLVHARHAVSLNVVCAGCDHERELRNLLIVELCIDR